MPALIISMGNRLRRDDGVAHAVAGSLRLRPGSEWRELSQLTPEIAADVGDYDTLVFLDADAYADKLTIEAVGEPSTPPAFSHVSTPAEIVALSRMLFGFVGRAFLCRIPVADLSLGEGLSACALAQAAQAARELESLLAGQNG